MTASGLGRNGCFFQASLHILSKEDPASFRRFADLLNGVVVAFRVGKERFWLGGEAQDRLEIHRGSAQTPGIQRATIQMGERTLEDLIEGRVKPIEALHRGMYDILGDYKVVLSLAQAFAILLELAVSSPSSQHLYQEYKSARQSPQVSLQDGGANSSEERDADSVPKVRRSRARQM